MACVTSAWSSRGQTLKCSRHNYQSLFGKEARISRPDLREQQKVSLNKYNGNERTFFKNQFICSKCTLKDTLTPKNSGASSYMP